MKKNSIISSILLAIICLITSCRNESPLVLKPSDRIRYATDTYWTELFETYWIGMNHNYVFWDLDKTDWDEVYDVYKPKFDALEGKNDTKVNLKAIKYFEELSSKLIDHHYQLTLLNVFLDSEDFSDIPAVPQCQYINHTILPVMNEIETREYYYPNDPLFIDDLINCFENHKDEDKITDVKVLRPVNRALPTFMSFVYDQKVAYLYFSKFSISNSLSLQNDTEVHAVFEKMRSAGQDGIKGIVIDLRRNGGGDLDDLNYLISDFIPEGESLKLGYTRSKKGMGRLDYTPLIPYEIKGSREYTPTPDVTCVVLVDLHSISMSEITTLALKALFPKTIVIGERTWGGQGPLFDDVVFTGGQFENEGISVYTSSTTLFTLDKECLEGIGITPDIEMLYNDNKTDFESGTDNVFDRAIEYIYESEGLN